MKHTTRDNTPQNAVIYTSAKSAPIITQFFVQKQMKNHRTKIKLEKNIFRKSNARNSASLHAKAQNSCMHAFTNLANGAYSIFDKLRVRNCQSMKFL